MPRRLPGIGGDSGRVGDSGFGSVARGEAGPESDIDLVAIHDDLDYSTRRERSEYLRTLASEAAGHRVFVFVTDWPEWTHRSTEVATSLEHAITADSVSLYHRDPNGVRWGKEIGMPATDREEAVGRLDNALRALLAVARSVRDESWREERPGG